METKTLRLALAQINPRVGDLSGNRKQIVQAADQARENGADIVVFPELAITGYPPEDLVLKQGFIRRNIQTLHEIASETRDIISIVGFVDSSHGLYNAAAVIEDGKIADVYHKNLLPNYGVFDEERYFEKGQGGGVYTLDGITFAVNICEDIWFEDGPAQSQCRDFGAKLIIAINASPYHRGKWHEREEMLIKRATDNNACVVYLNTVGGQDELIFDGMSVVISPDGKIIARANAFSQDTILIDLVIPSSSSAKGNSVTLTSTLKPKPAKATPEIKPAMDDLEEVYNALVLGTRDYVRKNGFSKVVIGLSGGIDSALVLAVACDALGPENVWGVTMPSRFSSIGTRTDAEVIAANFEAHFLELPIEEVFTVYKDLLSDTFAGLQPSLAEENLQSRIRGNLLMALSNKFGHIVLTTGNKSEMAVGYATIYGDMAGGFAVLKDVPKTLVWQLSRWRNRNGEIIPNSTIERPPSAELRDNQKDTDSLPEYDILDGILREYVECDKSLDEIVSLGYDEATVRRVMTLVDVNEYKRRQAPPGVKITSKAFGRDRRLPITNAFRDF